MADEIAVDSFLNLLGQSDLLPDDQLLSLLDQVRAEGRAAASARKLADSLVERQILTVWQADMLMKGKNRGFRLGPYRILKPLGQGGMSKVFLAEHETMRRRCAIKVLPSKYQEDADLLKRFELEAVAIAALDHPNIVRAYDFNKDERYGKKIPYLVMEYVEGPDLQRMVNEQGPLDFRKAADFICQAAQGLAHAHTHGFVHRDIKPANLLVDPQGVLKVLDLGLATFAEAEQALSGDEGAPSAVGTADYVAPEQVVDSRNVDGRADIYSLGLTFYFLLTGRRPFSKPTIMELLMAHRNEKPEPITTSRPDMPMDLDAIIDKMTAKSPFQRYQTAKDLAEKLQKWLKESGSARTYSRISTLMAEALRSKQPSAQDTTRSSAVRTEDTELELARLTEEPNKDNATVESLAEGVKETPADAAKREPTSSSSGTKIGRPQSKAAGGATTPNGDRPTGAVPSSPPQAPAMDDLIASLPPAEPLVPSAAAATSGSHGKLKALKKRPSKFREFMRTPLPWIGLIGVVFLAVIVFLFVLIASVPTSPPPESHDTTASEPVDLTPDSSDTKEGIEAGTEDASKATGPKPSSTASTKEPKTPNKETDAASKTSNESDSGASPKELKNQNAPEGTTPKVTPAPVVSSQTTESKAADTTKAEPKKVQQKPAPKKVDKTALLADLYAMNLDISAGGDPQVTLRLRNIARTTCRTLQIDTDVEDETTNVMAIELNGVQLAESNDLILSVEVKCAGDDGKLVSVWSQTSTVLTRKKTAAPLRGARLNQAIEPKVKAVFDRFKADVLKARGKEVPAAESDQ